MQLHKRPTRPCLDATQIHQLLEAARGHDLKPLLEIAVATAMRRGELLALTWQDIDLAAKTLTVTRTLLASCTTKISTMPKYGMRQISLTPHACKIFEQHRERQGYAKQEAGAAWQEHDLVFCTALGTYLNVVRDIQEEFQTLVNAADMLDIHFHDLRYNLLFNVGNSRKGATA